MNLILSPFNASPEVFTGTKDELLEKFPKPDRRKISGPEGDRKFLINSIISIFDPEKMSSFRVVTPELTIDVTADSSLVPVQDTFEAENASEIQNLREMISGFFTDYNRDDIDPITCRMHNIANDFESWTIARKEVERQTKREALAAEKARIEAMLAELGE